MWGFPLNGYPLNMHHLSKFFVPNFLNYLLIHFPPMLTLCNHLELMSRTWTNESSNSPSIELVQTWLTLHFPLEDTRTRLTLWKTTQSFPLSTIYSSFKIDFEVEDHYKTEWMIHLKANDQCIMTQCKSYSHQNHYNNQDPLEHHIRVPFEIGKSSYETLNHQWKKNLCH
jgi:hypothetical protein